MMDRGETGGRLDWDGRGTVGVSEWNQVRCKMGLTSSDR